MRMRKYTRPLNGLSTYIFSLCASTTLKVALCDPRLYKQKYTVSKEFDAQHWDDLIKYEMEH
jgi:hypothetical protein